MDMELQTVAISFSQSKSSIERLLKRKSLLLRLTPKHFFTLAEDLLLILAISTADPVQRSLWAGASFIVAGWLLITWMQGFNLSDRSFSIIGPYRFVRRPQRLAITLLALGLSISARSFPALIFSLCLLPYFYWAERLGLNRPQTAGELDLLRYRQHVPALVPTLFPYMHTRSQRAKIPFSWRRALFHFEPRIARLFVSILAAWLLCLLLEWVWIPYWGAVVVSLLPLVWDLAAFCRQSIVIRKAHLRS